MHQKYILEQVLSDGSTAQNGQKVLFTAKIHYLTVGLSRPSPIYRASQDLKIPFKTLKSAYFYLKHAQIPQKYILEQVLSEGSTAQNGQKVLFDSENPLSHYSHPIYSPVKVTVKWAIKIENAPNRLGTTWNMCRNHPANFLAVKTWL